jgi:hypothetical protein
MIETLTLLRFIALVPGGRMPSSASGKMPDATSRGRVKMRPIWIQFSFRLFIGYPGWQANFTA